MADWIQIDPTLLTSGAFAALSGLPKGDQMLPVPPDPAATPFGTRYGNGSAYSFSAATQLGIGPVASASATLQTQTYAYDLMYYAPGVMNNPKDQPNGGLILGTWWGAGIRTRVQVMNFDAKVQMTLGTIAAAASIGLVDASFSVEGLGMADVSMFSMLPDPGKFDQNSLKLILRAMVEIEKSVLIPKKNLVAVPFMILVSNAGQSFADPIGRAHAQLFAIRRIRDGIAQDVAIANAVAANLDPATVELVYTKWANTSPGTPVPSPTAVQNAKAWLDRAKLG
jgi:hypothetical protein